MLFDSSLLHFIEAESRIKNLMWVHKKQIGNSYAPKNSYARSL
jgi:hypothetical protein